MDAIAPLLLLFSLTGGYTFLQVCHVSRFRAEGLEWERNLFEAGLAGGLLFLFVKIFAIPLLTRLFPALTGWWFAARVVIPFPNIGALFLAVVAGWLFARVVNARIPSEEGVRRAVESYGGELLILLHNAARTGTPVSLTMSNRKVYVGFIRATPTLRYPHTRILPTMSGYRHESTLKVHWETIYWSVYESLEKRRKKGEIVIGKEAFGIVLPIDQICSANIFDEGTYSAYFSDEALDKAT